MMTNQPDQFSVLIKAIAECVIETLSEVFGNNKVHLVTYTSRTYAGSGSSVIEVWYGASTSDRFYIIKINNDKKPHESIPQDIETYAIYSPNSRTEILITPGSFDPDSIKNRLLQSINPHASGLLI